MRRAWLALLVACACRDAPPPPVVADDASVARRASDDAATSAPDGAALPARRIDDLGAWLRAISAGPRVLAIGELHARTDRAATRSALARFTDEVLPAIGDRVSDLVVETWIVDPRCGVNAAEAARRVDTAMRRPPATRSELATLGRRARAAGIQPHVLRLTCADHAAIAPLGGDLQVETLLDVVTRELGRVTASAIAHRDAEAGARPLIVVYGGALHNDLDPYDSVAAWSIGPRLDALTGGRYVEVDLYVPELAEADPLARTEPWFPRLAEVGTDAALVIERRPRSYLVLLPRSAAPR